MLALMIFLFWYSGEEISAKINKKRETVDINLNIDLDKSKVEETHSGMFWTNAKHVVANAKILFKSILIDW